MTRPFSVLVLVVVLLGLTACPATTDYGQTCQMNKPVDGGITPILVDPDAKDPSFDYIALGAPECDDQVCLRSAFSCSEDADCDNGSCGCPGGTQPPCACAENKPKCGTCLTPYTDIDNKAAGYCTRSCMDDTDCQPDYLGRKGLVCTQLLFSQDYLKALHDLCTSPTDPTCLYNQLFGSSGVSPMYCLKPRVSK
ncbi:MAG: hypothetical protein QM765_11230 [Myxococcales bacterium]